IDNVLNKPKAKPNDKATDAKDKKQSKQSPVFEEVAANPGQSLTLIGASCNDFSWFKKGAVLEYDALDNKGKVEAGIFMEVRHLTNKGSATNVDVEGTMSSPNFNDLTYCMDYMCDGEMV